jgi:integrating conjugative element protein (TIGR03758 family)
VSPEQRVAFAGGAGVAPEEVLLAIALIVAVLFLLWLVWVAFGQLRAWAEGRATLFDLLWTLTRACLMVLVVGFYVRP